MTKGYPEEYEIFKIHNQFLSDILFVLQSMGINMVHKQKRITKDNHKSYIRRIRQLNKELNYINIEPSIDPLQVIQKTKACISISFTSTAMIANQEGKPSVFYGIDELKVWIESIQNNIDYK